jgi:translation initiation factor IF-3
VSSNQQSQKDNNNRMTASQTLANERIRVPQVRLIDPDGSNAGVVATNEALSRARRAGLDLVAINPQATPMVVKIVDLNKWLYEQKREAKDRARKSREAEIVQKEIQLRPVTDVHDISIKAKNAIRFLSENCKVRVVVKFRGREMAHQSLGKEVLNQFLTAVGEYRLERDPSMQGNALSTTLLPPKS